MRLSSPSVLRRKAWVLIAPTGDYISSLSASEIVWTADPAAAMSWLDPEVASSRLRLLDSLPANSRLISLELEAEINSQPLQWRLSE
jgi:hypothetical protein